MQKSCWDKSNSQAKVYNLKRINANMPTCCRRAWLTHSLTSPDSNQWEQPISLRVSSNKPEMERKKDPARPGRPLRSQPQLSFWAWSGREFSRFSMVPFYLLSMGRKLEFINLKSCKERSNSRTGNYWWLIRKGWWWGDAWVGDGEDWLWGTRTFPSLPPAFMFILAVWSRPGSEMKQRPLKCYCLGKCCW